MSYGVHIEHIAFIVGDVKVNFCWCSCAYVAFSSCKPNVQQIHRCTWYLYTYLIILGIDIPTQVVSFDLPPEMSHVHPALKSGTLESWTSKRGHYQHEPGLYVLHSQASDEVLAKPKHEGDMVRHTYSFI